MGVEFLGAAPLDDPRIGKIADYGVGFLDEYPESPASIAYFGYPQTASKIYLATDLYSMHLYLIPLSF